MCNLENKRKTLDNFLKDLSKLTQYYNIEITGCGCCGSPQLMKLKEEEYVGYCLKYDRNTKKYKID